MWQKVSQVKRVIALATKAHGKQLIVFNLPWKTNYRRVKPISQIVKLSEQTATAACVKHVSFRLSVCRVSAAHHITVHRVCCLRHFLVKEPFSSLLIGGRIRMSLNEKLDWNPSECSFIINLVFISHADLLWMHCRLSLCSQSFYIYLNAECPSIESSSHFD